MYHFLLGKKRKKRIEKGKEKEKEKIYIPVNKMQSYTIDGSPLSSF